MNTDSSYIEKYHIYHLSDRDLSNNFSISLTGLHDPPYYVNLLCTVSATPVQQNFLALKKHSKYMRQF